MNLFDEVRIEVGYTPTTDWHEKQRYSPTHRPQKQRFTRAQADNIISKLTILSEFNHKICGSYRREKPTVGDVDVLIITSDFHKVVKWVKSRYDVLWCGPQKISFVVDGIQVDFRKGTPETFVTMMLYFTGSHKENIRMRSKAKRMGLKLNEYGLWRGDEKVLCESEYDVYKALDLIYKLPKER